MTLLLDNINPKYIYIHFNWNLITSLPPNNMQEQEHVSKYLQGSLNVISILLLYFFSSKTRKAVSMRPILIHQASTLVCLTLSWRARRAASWIRRSCSFSVWSISLDGWHNGPDKWILFPSSATLCWKTRQRRNIMHQ